MTDPYSGARSRLKPPAKWLLFLEGRAPWELAATMAAAPLFKRLPKGDRHGVLVFPGLAASDITTVPLRNFLRTQGYVPHPWQQGLNLGPREGVVESSLERIRQLARSHGDRISLIGWSLGGVYARELAKQAPECVRCVITLGSPFAGHPRATNAWRVFEILSGKSAHDPELLAGLSDPPPVPTTSIFSRSDGVVAWQCSVNADHPHAENIEVPASHLGLGMNPLALFAVADRLAQDPTRWQRFDAGGARRWFFRTHHHVTPAE